MFAFVITTGMVGLRNASSWRQILAILLASSVIAIHHASKTVKTREACLCEGSYIQTSPAAGALRG